MRRSIAVIPLLIAFAGCLPGGTSVDSTLLDYTFKFQTVYSYWDETSIEIDDKKIIVKDRESVDLVIQFSGASFDPYQDHRLLDIPTRLKYAHEEGVNGSFSVRIANIDKARGGSTATHPTEKTDPAKSVYLKSYTRSFAISPVNKDQQYPAEFPILGSREIVTVFLDDIGAPPRGSVRGRIELEVARVDSDSPAARTGFVGIDFVAPIVNEWLAECNASAGFFGGAETACDPTMDPPSGW